jgi:CDP-glucose 4,6-dehydratase
MITDYWRGKRVLITGHTGFKGGWLAHWLQKLDAKVSGLALAPDTNPSLFDLLQLGETTSTTFLDIRDKAALRDAVKRSSPEVVFHLAAQSLVRRSYDFPGATFATNVMGTANLLDACRDLPDLMAIVVVTTDKVYENKEWVWPYRETDSLGGKDPYSASKAATELVVASYFHSYFSNTPTAVVTARGGNVIGGGDWSEDRLIPDMIRATKRGTALQIRSPRSVRPWQHVLALLHGYLSLAQAVVERRVPRDGAWNFGPSNDDFVSVQDLIARLGTLGLQPQIEVSPSPDKPESRLLTLDSSKALAELRWKSALDLQDALSWTVAWYAAANANADMRAFSSRQIEAYTERLP